MTVAPIYNVSRIADICDRAFQAFCDDMADVFGVNMHCHRRKVDIQAAGDLLSHFEKLAAVHLVRGEGVLDGTFHLLFDQGGLFVLSGVFVMLAESRIREEAERGSMEDAENLKDAAREVGNLLIGSWDRVFHDECDGHSRFLKARTFIGRPWDDPSKIGLQADTDVFVGLYEMTMEPYPSFNCAVLFPSTILGDMESGEPSEAVDAPSAAHMDAEEPVEDSAGDETTCPPTRGQEDQPQAAIAPTVESLQVAEPTGPLDDATQSQAGAKAETAEVSTPDAPDLARVDAAHIGSGSQRQNGALAKLLRTPVAQIMEPDVIWAEPDDPVRDVIAKMQQRNAGYVLVGREGLLEGLVSSSNISGAVSLYLRPMFAKWRRPQDDATLEVKIKWIMSHPVRTIRPDTTLAAMIESMRRYGGRCLPVVDEQGAVQGIVTAFAVLLRILEVDKNFSWEGRPPQAPALLI